MLISLEISQFHNLARHNAPVVVGKAVFVEAVEYPLKMGAGWVAKVTRKKFCGIKPP
jgi:hypothetical protein